MKEQTLMNKDNFWTPLYESTGGGLQAFCDWIDIYKTKIGWNNLFRDNVKFHDLPEVMQTAVVNLFLSERGYVFDEKWDSEKELSNSVREALQEELQRYCPSNCIFDSLLKVGEEKCKRCTQLDAIYKEQNILENRIEQLEFMGGQEHEIYALRQKIDDLDIQAADI